MNTYEITVRNDEGYVGLVHDAPTIEQALIDIRSKLPTAHEIVGIFDEKHIEAYT